MTNSPGNSGLPADAREALKWFVNNHGLYVGSTRGLFLSDSAEEQQVGLEAAVIGLKARGFVPFVTSGEIIYRQADYLWKEAREHAQFGRPLASKLELELGGADVVVVDGLEAPENSRQLWYLVSQVLYPRAIAGKATIITTPLSYQEFARYGSSCPDADFCGKPINWEKISSIIDNTMVTLDLFRLSREESLPPMLKSEYYLYTALKERNLDVIPQHVLGDYMLDFVLKDRDRRLNIECDSVSALAGGAVQRQEAKRDLVLLSDGWQVLRFTDSEVVSNRAACAEATDEVWRTGRKRNVAGRLLTGKSAIPMSDLPVDDEVQLAAITHGGGPAAVTGGAGTGKTTCIVQRTAYLISQGINPENILVVSHNVDTLKLLKKAVSQVLEKSLAHRVHTLCWQDLGLKILKENLPAIRRKPPLKIEPNPQKMISRLLAKVKKEVDPARLELSGEPDEFYIAAVISMYKAHLVSPKQAADEAQSYGEEIIAKIYQMLEEQLQKANRIDRDDVVSMAVQILLEHPETRCRYQRQFEFVLVDDYQDVTVAQDMLARVLAAPEDNLFMVGDEDETLTEFKNACPELFTEMALRMPHARSYILERNWRCHPEIVDHARQLLAGLQRRRINKEFTSAWGQAAASAIIGPVWLPDEHEEASWVAKEIQILADSGRSYGDIAVLYRHNVYSSILEEALQRCGVKYMSAQSESYPVPDEIEDMRAFLKLVMDPDGPRARECFERVCQLRAREIDPKLSATISGFAEANNLSYLKAIEIYTEATADQSCRELEQLVRIIRTMNQDNGTIPPAEMIELIRRTLKLNEYYRSIKVPPGASYEPLKKLGQFEDESRNFKTVADFVKHLATQTQSGVGSSMSDTGVQILPLQECKGAEFPVVFLVGLAEGIFPAESVIDLEEERRICYVGFTRAKELLYLSYPASFAGVGLKPSHFLIDARLLAAPSPMYQYGHEVEQQPGEDKIASSHTVQAPEQYQRPASGTLLQGGDVRAEGQQQYNEQMAAAAAQQQYNEQMAAAAAQQQYNEQMAAAAAQQQYNEQMAAAAAQQQYDEQMAAAAQQQHDEQMAAAAAQQQHDEQMAAAAAQQQHDEQMAAIPRTALPPQNPHRRLLAGGARLSAYAQPAIGETGESGPRLIPAPVAETSTATPPTPVPPLAGAPTGTSEPPRKPGKGPRTKAPVGAEPLASGIPFRRDDEDSDLDLSRQSSPAPAGAGDASLPRSVPPAPLGVPVAADAVPTKPNVRWFGSPDVGLQAYTGSREKPLPELPPLPSPRNVQPGEADAANSLDPRQDIIQQPQASKSGAMRSLPSAGSIPSGSQIYQNASLPPTDQGDSVHQPSLPGRLPDSQKPYPGNYHQPGQPGTEPNYTGGQPGHQPGGDHGITSGGGYVSHLHPSCPSCATALEANARFCGGCGYNLPERVPACPICGAPLESSAKFCGECGSQLSGAPVTHGSNLLTNNLMRMHELKDKQHSWMIKLLKKLEK